MRYVKALVWELIHSFGYEIREARQRPSITLKTLNRILYLERMASLVAKRRGAIVECGVGHGDSLLYLSYLVSDSDREVWGFDSFEGFPEPSPEDRSVRNPKKGEWGHVRYEGVMEMFRSSGLSEKFMKKFHLVKGFFNKSLSAYDKQPIALLHLDVDLYQSYKDCLNALYDYVIPGGVIMFDEYEDIVAFPGAKKAIDQFFADKSDEITKDSSGKYFIIKS
jgi:hypothetical protein